MRSEFLLRAEPERSEGGWSEEVKNREGVASGSATNHLRFKKMVLRSTREEVFFCQKFIFVVLVGGGCWMQFNAAAASKNGDKTGNKS